MHFSCINIDFMTSATQTSTGPNQTSATLCAKKDIHHTRNSLHQTTPDVDHTRPPPHQTFIKSDIHHAMCLKKGHPPQQTLTRLDIHHTMRKIGHPPHRTSTKPDQWWMSLFLHAVCGGCPFFTHSVWWV